MDASILCNARNNSNEKQLRYWGCFFRHSKQFKAILFKIRVENVKDKDLLTYIGIQIDWGKITLGALHSFGSQS